MILGENELELAGFLLEPIQRVCRYPLLLKQLVDVTPESHTDHNNVVKALQVMEVGVYARACACARACVHAFQSSLVLLSDSTAFFIFALPFVQTMAATINDDKRHKEELDRLQRSLENWKGPDIATWSTQLIHDGPLVKVGCFAVLFVDWR